MLKDLFDKGKCALGFHVEAWRYAREGSCQQASVCVRCQVVSDRVVHDWPDGWALVSPDDCQMARACRRCGERETRTEHDWGAPAYVADGSCDQVRGCSRCGSEMPAAAAHVWNAWVYTEEGSCRQTLGCSRCAAPGADTRTAHEWSLWQYSPFYEAQVRVCSRCGEMPFDADPADEDGTPLSLQRFAAAVLDVSGASDMAALRERVVAHQRVLLSPAVQHYFKFAMANAAGDAAQTETLQTLAQVFDRCRVEGIDAVLRPAPPPIPSPADAGLDRRLPGHWRHVESMSSPGLSLVIDTHLVLETSGRFEWWSKSSGSGTSGRERGVWSNNDGTLVLAFDNGSRAAWRYHIESGRMFLPDERRYRLWQRV
jgi:hypothetical protein